MEWEYAKDKKYSCRYVTKINVEIKNLIQIKFALFFKLNQKTKHRFIGRILFKTVQLPRKCFFIFNNVKQSAKKVNTFYDFSTNHFLIYQNNLYIFCKKKNNHSYVVSSRVLRVLGRVFSIFQNFKCWIIAIETNDLQAHCYLNLKSGQATKVTLNVEW